MPHPVTLSSDFGRYYPAAMRGVLAARGIDKIHDVTHDLPAHDVTQAGFWLATLVPTFPRAVHCVVVDPGVGGDRRVLVLRAGGHAVVAPDNGVGWPVAEALAGDGSIEAFVFEHVTPASDTFHGRDVFAPLSAAVATVSIDRLERLPTVEPVDDPVRQPRSEPTRGDGWIEADIVAIDGFGTAITAAPGGWLPDTTQVAVDGRRVPLARRYGAVEAGEPLVTVGSHGRVELAANRAAGAEAFGVGVGDRVRISWASA